jgi:hypothetical protein
MLRYIKVTVCFACTLAALGSLHGALARSQPFSIKVSSPHERFESGSDIELRIILMNTSNHDIFVGAPLQDQADIVDGFWATVQDSLGHHLPRIERSFATSHVIIAQLSPGKTLAYTMVVNGMNGEYDLTRPGKYMVQVHRTDPTTKIEVSSNVLTLRIVTVPNRGD